MEGSTVAADAPQAVDSANLGEALRRTAAAHPDLLAVRTLDDTVSLTWSQLRERVDALAAGLAGLGVGHRDTVALMLTNRPEFHVADLATVTLGATPFSIYLTSSPEQIEYVIGDAAARVAICERAFLARILAAKERLPLLEHVVLVDPEDGSETPAGVVALSEVEGSNAGFDVDAALAAVEPDDVATLIYTSGTTGPPKGVELAHRNILGAVRCVQEIIQLDPGARVISWLPAAHIAERAAHHYIPVVYAASITTSPDPRAIVQTLPQVRPNWFFAVPRVWEKLKAGLEAMLAAQPEEMRGRVEGALEASKRRVRLRQAGEPVPAELEQAVQAADDAVFSNLRAMLGLSEVVTVNVGAAPTPPEVIEFFHALGIELAELWGMSETCGAGTVNRPGAVRIGTVGPPSPGVEVRLAEDGELLIRGACVMKGYRGQPEKTAEALDADGWLHTGDVATIDADGYVKIVDRKKELIINAAGKNMSPANIEATLKGAAPLIGQACVIGDGRPYNTALIVLDSDFAPAWAAQQGIEGADLAALAADERVVAAVQAGVDAANARLSRVEQVKRFTIVQGDWLPGGDELTPTMKLKRRPIGDKYAAAIEAMYAGS
jgi:long-subunit acyl-CoA synthetase (AMP-forming)